MAISLLDISAAVLAAWAPEFELLQGGLQDLAARWSAAGGANSADAREVGQGIILAPQYFLRREEPHLPGRSLPSSWDVTSDSIAARLAIVTGADELVLLKSVPPPDSDLQPPSSLRQLAASGYVDRFFPELAAQVPRIRLVDLRGTASCRPKADR
jgi:aspartokinase-like uncharacterized kinase